MKGIVFTEFMEMVEANFGIMTLESIIEEAGLPHGGAYTSVGTYPPGEMEALVNRLSVHTNLDRNQLLEAFGRQLFRALADGYPHFFPEGIGMMDFLATIHDHIHIEVKKLYPDAELPALIVQDRDNQGMTLLYRSSRKMSALARGLLLGAMDHFQEYFDQWEEYVQEDGSEVKIFLRKRSEAHG